MAAGGFWARTGGRFGRGDQFLLKSLGSFLAAHDYRPIPVIVLALGLLTTLAFWHAIESRADNHIRDLAAEEAKEIAYSIGETSYAAEQMLEGADGLWRANGRVSTAQWNAYVGAFEGKTQFPGRGLGFTKLVGLNERQAHIDEMRREGMAGYDIRPPGDRLLYAPIIRLAPRSERVPALLGFDVLSEPIRREAMEKARDTGRPAMSGKLQLLDDMATFILYLPIYRDIPDTANVEARRRNIDGFVFSIFVAADFLQQGVQQRLEKFDMALFDGSAGDPGSLVYESRQGFAEQTQAAGLLTSRTIEIGGRVWTLVLSPTATFIQNNRSQEPLHVLVGGIDLSLLLFALSWMLTGNIAERRRVAGSIQAAERRLRSIFENAPIALCIRDRDGKHVIANEAYAQSHGVTSAEVIGKKVGEFSRRLNAHDPHEQDLQLLAEGAPEMSERDIILPSGEPRVFFTIKYPVVDQSGRDMEVCRISIDVTDWKKIEDQLRHSQKLEAIGQLTGGIAHDFNNLLQVISGNAELLSLDGESDPAIKRHADSIKRASDRASELTKRLLAFSRRQNLDFRIVDVNQSVMQFEGMLNRTLGEKIRIRTVLCTGMPLVRLDAAELETAILNLAVNARDAMPDGGSLIIETAIVELDGAYVAKKPYARAGLNVMLAISDSGTGIPLEVLDHVFEPFFTTKDVGQGSGMGLSMVYGFVKQSNGHVEIYSEVGQGTTIRMYFPYMEGGIAPSPQIESPGKEGELSGSETILVTEDDPGVREYVVGQLTKRGYRVLAASDGASAFEMARANPEIDLVFTDIVMPGKIDGIELVRRLEEIRPGMRFLFTSGYSEQALLSQEPLPGGGAVLNKPYGALALARRVREVLDKPA